MKIVQTDENIANVRVQEVAQQSYKEWTFTKERLLYIIKRFPILIEVFCYVCEYTTEVVQWDDTIECANCGNDIVIN